MGDLPGGLSLLPVLDDLVNHRIGRRMRGVSRSGCAITHASRPFFAEAGQSLLRGAYANTGQLGSLVDAQAFIEHATDKQRPTSWGQMGMFVQVHPGLLTGLLIRTSSLPGLPRVNNPLHS